MYCDINSVRELSGLKDSTLISDEVVKSKISQATSMIDSVIANRYTLPLAFHRQNKITFTGTGSGSGTLTAVVNGSSYAISISNGLTAGQATDLMREAMADNDDFITEIYNDAIDNSSVLTLISRSDSTALTTADAQVTISDAGGTVSGITAAAGTKTNRHQRYVYFLASEIAASLLLMDQYGPDGVGSQKDGNERMERIEKELLKIQGGNSTLNYRLFDEVTGQELSQGTDSTVESYPNDTSDADESDPTTPKTTMNQDF